MNDTTEVDWQYFLLGTGPVMLIVLIVLLINCGHRKRRMQDREDRGVDIAVGVSGVSAEKPPGCEVPCKGSDSCSQHTATSDELEAGKYVIPVNSDSEHEYSEPVEQEEGKRYTPFIDLYEILPRSKTVQRETDVVRKQSSDPDLMKSSQVKKNPLPLPPRQPIIPKPEYTSISKCNRVITSDHDLIKSSQVKKNPSPLPPRQPIIPKPEYTSISKCNRVITPVPLQSTDSIQTRHPNKEDEVLPLVPPLEVAVQVTSSQNCDKVLHNVTEDPHSSLLTENTEAYSGGGYFIPCNEEPLCKLQPCPSVGQTVVETGRGLGSQIMGSQVCKSNLSILGSLLQENLGNSSFH